MFTAGLPNVATASRVNTQATYVQFVRTFSSSLGRQSIRLTVQILLRYTEYAVTQLLQALRYRPDFRGFEFRCGVCDFSFPESFRLYYGYRTDWASDRNEYQGTSLRAKMGQCVGLTNLSLSCADCLKLRRVSASWSCRTFQGLRSECLILHFTSLNITFNTGMIRDTLDYGRNQIIYHK
jgi:hypothetical protein